MPSLEHETLVELFSRDPHAALALLAATDRVRIPAHDSVEVRPADERELTPASLRVDVVVLLRRGEPVLVILLEVQLGRDDDKRYTWPFYVAAVRLRYRCPVCLLVYSTRDEVARWCGEPIDLGQPDSAFVPLVVQPRQVPRVTHPRTAEQMPYAALLSAVAHGREEGSERMMEAVWAALQRFDEDERRVWAELLVTMVDDAARKVLEAKMNLDAIKEELVYFIEGKAKGKAEGKTEALREAVLDLAEAYGLDVTDARRSQVQALEAEALETVRLHLKQHRAWPTDPR